MSTEPTSPRPHRGAISLIFEIIGWLVVAFAGGCSLFFGMVLDGIGYLRGGLGWMIVQFGLPPMLIGGFIIWAARAAPQRKRVDEPPPS